MPPGLPAHPFAKEKPVPKHGLFGRTSSLEHFS